mgnify:FL=1
MLHLQWVNCLPTKPLGLWGNDQGRGVEQAGCCAVAGEALHDDVSSRDLQQVKHTMWVCLGVDIACADIACWLGGGIDAL